MTQFLDILQLPPLYKNMDLVRNKVIDGMRLVINEIANDISISLAKVVYILT